MWLDNICVTMSAELSVNIFINNILINPTPTIQQTLSEADYF